LIKRNVVDRSPGEQATARTNRNELCLEGMNMTSELNFPPVVIHSHDNNDLVLVATIASRLGRSGAEFLLCELDRASLCASEPLPANVVSFGSRVTYRVDGLTPKTSTLVLPDEAQRRWRGLSVLTPLGTALVGLRVGAAWPFIPRKISDAQ
jgi:regulator of nucleoside diphosphate kinase